MVSAVAAAEHGAIRGNTAPFAHPWLLYSLGKSVRLTDDEMVILPETAQFLEMISKDCERSPLAAAGVLGMGSERLLVPEYTAARNAFEKCWPECDFRRFLNANIEEDVRHAELMENVGRALLSLGHRDGDFLSGAQVGIEARIVYYDALVERVGTGRISE
jgi:hypothetical protein